MDAESIYYSWCRHSSPQFFINFLVPTDSNLQTISTLLSFVLAMLVHPEVQKRAQQELDDVLAMDHLPTFADRPDLPYIDCIAWECLRWYPVLPLGVAHSVSENDEYNGFFIPRGTSVLPNIWSV